MKLLFKFRATNQKKQREGPFFLSGGFEEDISKDNCIDLNTPQPWKVEKYWVTNFLKSLSY